MKRFCCKCRGPFVPESPYFFKCDDCKHNEFSVVQNGRAVYGAPVEHFDPFPATARESK